MTREGLGTRIEQALAFGRSLDWIVDHLGAKPSDVDAALRRMDLAVADDPHLTAPLSRLTINGRPISSYFGPADPSTIAELIDAVCPLTDRAQKRSVA